MNTIRDAYQPPTGSTKSSKFWLRFSLVALLLVIAFGLMIYTGISIQRQILIREMNSRRYPVEPEGNMVPDGSGYTVSAETQP